MLKALQKPKTLKENALIELRKAIMFGYFKPGQRLVERVLCEELEVSRTIVRECLSYLESERLVSTIANIGPTVAKLNKKEIVEIYRLRSLIESDAVSEFTKHAKKSDIKKLNQLVDNIEQCLLNKDIIKAIEYTHSFYENIFTISEMPVCWDVVQQLNGRITQLRVLSLSSKGREKNGPNNLRNIIQDISKKDGDAAAHSCKVHVDNALKVVLAQIEEQERGDSSETID